MICECNFFTSCYLFIMKFNKTNKLKALDFNPVEHLIVQIRFYITEHMRYFCPTASPFLLLSHFKNASPYEQFTMLIFSDLSKGNPLDRWRGLGLGGGECCFFTFSLGKCQLFVFTRSENYGKCTLLEYMEFFTLHSFNPISHSMK